ncbi:rho GTPase-activating protein 32 isoform X1 [Leptopilina heterotoma]|uniref:rho GTPase-activating protein 32 isoform X1 n=2 Tax=Leptopilina heterotoma TaxID=63436 RepID=UPI001CA8C537|nr:rho GTPase-activating protein 32 isoform X1 [Leptopilina heterotoma]
MPGPMPEKPRVQTHKMLGCNRTDDFNTPVSSGSNMGSIARFPKLDECAHFHYEHVELSSLDVSLSEGSNDSDSYEVRVTSGDACWTLQRSYENFVMFDKHLHRCIFDRKFSSLPKLADNRPKTSCDILKEYLIRFSQLNHEGLNCGPVLNWLQLDNRGRRILVPESDSCPINTPAVAAAYAIRPYAAQAQDEISFQVGDMISVIDMPPPGESTWWRGKHGFAVGFFPADCVAVIGDKVPRHLAISTTVRSKLPVKPVLRKHGKLIAFFRSFILNRPSRRRLKQSGILKERVFGCDLGEHLLNSGHDVPAVLTCCAEFIETHGLVDGIYRLSGVTSNIQRLRHAFDEDRVPALHSDESIRQDIHSVASLLKMYFRELPNPLCTYQLYSTFVNAVQADSDAERLRRMRDTVRKLPPPHYRTLEFLMRHLVRVAAKGTETGMTPRNVAIVWAPNLLRCKELEVGGVAALQGVGVQAVVTEFLICYAELIFGDGPVGRPKSLAITTSARLLSLEEARNRNLRSEAEYIEVGAGPAGLPTHYHTVIDLPPRKRSGSKRSPSLNWRALFARSSSGTKGKARPVGTPPQAETPPNFVNSLRRLRSVKSADSLDGEDSLGPLLGPPPSRPCGHSRSVSHDSYFDHLADAPNTASPLDLSEIQLNFDLEEREMRMFSEEESTGIASVEASPRRQRSDGPLSVTVSGGSKRKRSRLEERLHCDVELRFIDSQSPDQVMVSADVHGMETPSPLTTPGYLPLLSEDSTPLTPATLPISPLPANSPRISFRSFNLPLDVDNNETSSEKLNRSSASSDKVFDTSHRLSINIDSQSVNVNECESMQTYDRLLESYDAKSLESSVSQPMFHESNGVISDFFDQEMTPCDRLVSSLGSDPSEASNSLSPRDELSDRLSSCLAEESKHFDSRNISEQKPNTGDRRSSSNEDALANASNTQANDVAALPLSSLTDLDSPMSCEQTFEDLPDSGFVICDSSDKIFTITDTQPLASNANDSGEWVMVERTTSETNSPKDSLEGTVNPAIATEAPQLQSNCENVSRTSLDLTMASNVDTDTSCIGTSELTDSPVQETNDIYEDENKPSNSAPLNEQRDDVPATFLTCSPLRLRAQKFELNQSEKHPSKLDHGGSKIEQKSLNQKSKIDEKLDNIRLNQKRSTIEENSPQFSERQKPLLPSDGERKNVSQLQEAFEKNIEKCHTYGYSQLKQRNHNQYQFRMKHLNDKRKQVQNTQVHNNEVMIPSENAAQPYEVVHVPEGASGTASLASSLTFSNASSPVDDSGVLKDTAAILQELALQRLSGGVGGELSVPTRKRYDSEVTRDRRSFDSEIGREIVRERKMRQELDNARGKFEESAAGVPHLPPCLRARHARATRAALSRSLDEGKFNQMTGETCLSKKQSYDDSQHSSTPNVGSETIVAINNSDRLYAKNLGGLDLGDPQCRERIDKYKEERRMFLRDKYRSESFRASKAVDDGEQALLARLKQRASKPSLH